jgi:hypothetical protein
MKHLRPLLLGLMVIGAVFSLAGNGGTFASFSAQTTNAGSTFATGSLVLSNQLGSATACLSSSGSLNNNAGCSALLTGANLEPGSPLQTASLTISNGGALNASTLDASSFSLFAAGPCADTQVTNLTFNPSAGNPLCNAAVMSVQETGAAPWCWFGLGSGTTTCNSTTGTGTSHLDADTTHTLAAFTSAYTGGTDTGRALPVATTTAGSATLTSAAGQFTAADLGRAVSGSGIPLSTTILGVDSSTSVTLSSAATATAAAVSVTLSGSHQLDLRPVTAGTGPNNSMPALAASTSRTFTISLYLPNPTGSNQNALQALKSTFGLTWHIDQ